MKNNTKLVENSSDSSLDSGKILSRLAAILALLNKVKIDAGVIFCILFTVVYLAGSILLIALWRQFYIIVPILIFWIFYIWNAMPKRNRGINVHS